MIHAFFVTLGVLAAIMFIRFLPLIVAFIWVTLTSKVFWYCVLWLVALLAAIAGFPYGLIPMAISVPVLLFHLKQREQAEMREIALGYRRFDGSVIQNREATPQRENPPITKGDRFTGDGCEINWTPGVFRACA